MRPPSLKAADFQRALGSRPLARTAHFVLHRLPGVPAGVPVPTAAQTPVGATLAAPVSASDSVPQDELSTAHVLLPCPLVDDLAWRFGLVLPKKQARRSVTRSLIRHQARDALRRHGVAARLRFGPDSDTEGWVLRLRAPFDRQQYPSAASEALSRAVRQELDELWGRLLKGQA